MTTLKKSANGHTQKVSKWPHTKGQQTGTHKKSTNGHTQKVSKLASGLLDNGQSVVSITQPPKSPKGRP